MKINVFHRKRFWDRVDFSDWDGCWQWAGTKSRNGYGVVTFGSKKLYAHRVAYELVHGPIPAGLDLDHLCRNRACVNPAHLEPVTRRENLLRGIGPEVSRARARLITHCKNGHEFTPENTRGPANKRACRACARARSAQYRTRRREAIA